MARDSFARWRQRSARYNGLFNMIPPQKKRPCPMAMLCRPPSRKVRRVGSCSGSSFHTFASDSWPPITHARASYLFNDHRTLVGAIMISSFATSGCAQAMHAFVYVGQNRWNHDVKGHCHQEIAHPISGLAPKQTRLATAATLRIERLAGKPFAKRLKRPRSQISRNVSTSC
jgi:hypothetical protein